MKLSEKVQGELKNIHPETVTFSWDQLLQKIQEKTSKISASGISVEFKYFKPLSIKKSWYEFCWRKELEIEAQIKQEGMLEKIILKKGDAQIIFDFYQFKKLEIIYFLEKIKGKFANFEPFIFINAGEKGDFKTIQKIRKELLMCLGFYSAHKQLSEEVVELPKAPWDNFAGNEEIEYPFGPAYFENKLMFVSEAAEAWEAFVSQQPNFDQPLPFAPWTFITTGDEGVDREIHCLSRCSKTMSATEAESAWQNFTQTGLGSICFEYPESILQFINNVPQTNSQNQNKGPIMAQIKDF